MMAPPVVHPPKTLIQLVRTGDIDGVENYLNVPLKKYHEFVAETDNSGWTVVHHASSKGYYDILKLLLKGSFSDIRKAASRPSNMEETPLMVACLAEWINIDLVHHLLSVGADPNARNMQGCTAMHLVCMSTYPGKLPVVRLLKDMGANVNARCDVKYYIPLQYALWVGVDLDIVRFLLQHSRIPQGSSDPLNLAIEHMERAVPYALRYVRLNHDYVSAALQLQKVNVAVQLLQAGAAQYGMFSSRLLADVVYSSHETFEALLGALDRQLFKITLPFEVASTCPQEMKEKCFRSLLRQSIKLGVQLPGSSDKLNNYSLMFTKEFVSLETVGIIFKYFPAYDKPHRESRTVKSLQDICRPVARDSLVTAAGGEFKALCWLESSNVLPSHIRKFLLYEQ